MEQEFLHFLCRQSINPFQSRNIQISGLDSTPPDAAPPEQRLQILSEQELPSAYLDDFSSRLHQEWVNFRTLNSVDDTNLTQQIVQLTQKRLDLFMLTLQMQHNVEQNIPPLQAIVNKLPPQFIAFYFRELIELANANIKLETLLGIMDTHHLNLQQFTNLTYILQHLNSDLLEHIGHNPKLFNLDHSKLTHFVGFLNQDPFIAKQSLDFIDTFIESMDTFNAYVSLLTNPQHRNPKALKFIHQLFAHIHKPFTNTQWVAGLIAQQKHLDLGYYLGFFNSYTESQVSSFVSYLSGLTILDRVRLEVRLIFNSPNSLNQVIDA